MSSQYLAMDGQKQEAGYSPIQTGSQFGPGLVQTGSEDSYDIQWLENNNYDDSNKDYYVKYVEDESFRNFVKSLLHTVTGANNGPVKREQISSLTGEDCHGKDEKNAVVEGNSQKESKLSEKHSQISKGTQSSTQRKQEKKSSENIGPECSSVVPRRSASAGGGLQLPRLSLYHTSSRK